MARWTVRLAREGGSEVVDAWGHREFVADTKYEAEDEAARLNQEERDGAVPDDAQRQAALRRMGGLGLTF